MLLDASTGPSELFLIKWELGLFDGHTVIYPSDCNWVNVSTCKKMKNLIHIARRPMVTELKWDSINVTQRGHSMTMWTQFCPFLTPPTSTWTFLTLNVDRNKYFLDYLQGLPGQSVTK